MRSVLQLRVGRMDAATLIREYLLLGLRFDRVEEGYVDSFTGDPALRRVVEAEPRRIPPTWPARPTVCWPSCAGADAWNQPCRVPRRPPACAGVRRPQVRGPGRRVRRRGARPISTSHRQGRPGAVPRRRTASSTRRWAAAARSPSGCRPTAPARRYRPSASRKSIHAFSSALRDRVRAEYPLPDAETITYEIVTDKPWSGFNYYLGDYRSTVAVNADLKQQMSDLPRLVAHESYPGHHTEHCRKEAGLVAGRVRPSRRSSWSTPRNA